MVSGLDGLERSFERMVATRKALAISQTYTSARVALMWTVLAVSATVMWLTDALSVKNIVIAVVAATGLRVVLGLIQARWAGKVLARIDAEYPRVP